MCRKIFKSFPFFVTVVVPKKKTRVKRQNFEILAEKSGVNFQKYTYSSFRKNNKKISPKFVLTQLYSLKIYRGLLLLVGEEGGGAEKRGDYSVNYFFEMNTFPSEKTVSKAIIRIVYCFSLFLSHFKRKTMWRCRNGFSVI